MAKQRKTLFSPGPSTFFDEMEEEMNNTKKRKYKKGYSLPPPPEKSFLQFDPSKMEGFGISKKKFDSEHVVLKAQWKPPIKRPEPYTSLVSEHVEDIEENISSELTVNVGKKFLPNIVNHEMTPNCLEENNKLSEEDVENGEVIIIHSSQESLGQNSGKSLPSDCGHNLPEHNDLTETTQDIMVLKLDTETVHIQNDKESANYCEKEGRVVIEDPMKKFTSSVGCEVTLAEPIIPYSVSTLCENPKVFMYENGLEDITVKEELRLKSGNNLNPTQNCCKINKNNTEESQICCIDPPKTNIVTNTEKSDELEIINGNTITMKIAKILHGANRPNIESNDTHDLNNIETKDIFIESVFEDLCSTKINNGPEHEIQRDPNPGNESSFNVSSNDKWTVYSCTSANNASETNNVSVFNNRNIPKFSTDDKLFNDNNFNKYLEQKKSFNDVFKSEINRNSVEGDGSNGNKEMSVQEHTYNIQECTNENKQSSVGGDEKEENNEQGDNTIEDKQTIVGGDETIENKENNEQGDYTIKDKQNIVGGDETIENKENNEQGDYTIEDKQTIVGGDETIENKEINEQGDNTIEDKHSILGGYEKNENKENNEKGDNTIEDKQSIIGGYETNENKENNDRKDYINENKEYNVQGKNTNGNKEVAYLNSAFITHFISPEDVERNKEINMKNEFEKLLEEEKSINEEKIEIDEEYSCLMISNSQLDEIEKNYYESSNLIRENEGSKASDGKFLKSNHLISKEKKVVESNSTKMEVRFGSKNDNGTQTRYGSGNLLDPKLASELPTVQWPKSVLELQTKIRDLTQEIDQLNAMLMRCRREIWPQRHGNSSSA